MDHNPSFSTPADVGCRRCQGIVVPYHFLPSVTELLRLPLCGLGVVGMACCNASEGT